MILDKMLKSNDKKINVEQARFIKNAFCLNKEQRLKCIDYTSDIFQDTFENMLGLFYILLSLGEFADIMKV